MKPHMKLLGKCVLAALPLIALVIYFSQFTISFIDEEGPYYLWNREITETARDKYYDTIILGDSIANSAYIPELLSDGTINLALGGATPMENYYTLCEWLERHEPPKTCYISFNDSHFIYDNGFWLRSVYSHRYDLKTTVKMLKEAAAYNESSILTEHWLYDLLSYELWLPNKYITPLMNAGLNQRGGTNKAAWDKIELHRGNYIALILEQHAPQRETQSEIAEAFSVQPLFDDYYRKLIELCQANGIQVRIIKLPRPDSCVYTQEYKQAFHAYYDKLQADYPEISVDWFEHCDAGCFLDGSHMNIHGGMLFTKALKELYPDDFDDAPLSAGQIAGINDYLSMESDLGHIFDWAVGTGDTIYLYDGEGRSRALYGDPAGDWGLAARPVETDRGLTGDILSYTDGAERDQTAFVFQSMDGPLMVLDGGGTTTWNMAPGTDLGVLVVDADGGTVCEKSFVYNEAGFALVE